MDNLGLNDSFTRNFECPICFHPFDNISCQPRTLICGHTFCTICLNKTLINENINGARISKISCPLDREITKIYNFEKQLPIN